MDEIVLYRAPVRTGFPSPALDYAEERIDLTKALVKNPLSTFIIECSGDSMINAFIPQKALLIVDRSLRPVNGDIVLAAVNGEFTVKYLKKNDFRCWLVAANRHYPDLEITHEMNAIIWGVVTYIITDTKEVRQCML